MTEDTNISNLSKLGTLVGDLKEMFESNAWKYLSGLIKQTDDGINLQLRQPKTNNTPIFNLTNLMTERLWVLDYILNLPGKTIKEIEERMAEIEFSQLPLEEKLRRQNEKL